MKRRRVEGDVPPVLAVFTPADWPGRTVADKLSIWKEARRAHFEENGWPGGPLALLQESSDVQRRLEGRPLLPWSRTPSELAALNGDQYDPRAAGFEQAPSKARGGHLGGSPFTEAYRLERD